MKKAQIVVFAVQCGLFAVLALLFVSLEVFWARVLISVGLLFATANLIAGIADLVGTRVRIADLNLVIDHIQRRGHHRSRARFSHAESGCALDFRKWCPLDEPTTFLLIVESSVCPQDKVEAAAQALKDAGIQLRLDRDEKGRGRRLTVSCGQDLDTAITAARAVLTKGFGLSYDEQVRYRKFGGFSLRHHAVIGWNRAVDKRATQEGARIEAIGSLEVGMTGHIMSSGRAEFDGKQLDVLCRGGFIDPGTEVEIVDIKGDRIVVQKVTPEKEENTTS